MSVVNSYANALYEVARDQKLDSAVMNDVEQQMALMVSYLEGSKEIRVALLSPVTTAREKVSLIQEIAKRLNFSSLLSEFMILLAKKGRLSLLSSMKDAFHSIRVTSEGGMVGDLDAAEAMNETDVRSLAKIFSDKFGKKVTFRISTDPTLLAGMKVTVNGVTYDGTLRSQLQKLRDRISMGFSHGNATNHSSGP